ncbi:hypothetical protein [Actinomadura craniellae]|uniref:hypothetical protein n=1 Tax=Actinomadura craniellae TaxID=2231787 RepID=UPI0011BD893E|nr:hypothetical protein [Actinomadura craniellae]
MATSRAGVLTGWRREVAQRTSVWNAEAGHLAGRSRSWVMAAQVGQAGLVAEAPEGRCAGGCWPGR